VEPGVPKGEEELRGDAAVVSYFGTRAAKVSSLVLLAIALVLSVFLVWQVHASSSAFIGLYKDMKLGGLPLLTRLVISPAFRWTLVLLAGAGLLKEILEQNRKVTIAVNGIHILVVMIFIDTYYRGLLGPLIELISQAV